MVLLVALLIVALASATVGALVFRTSAEYKSVAAAHEVDQATRAARSGIDAAMAMIASRPDDPQLLLDNPAAFEHRLVTGEGEEGWYFTVFAPPRDGQAEPRYGLIDQGGLLNLNVATAEMLIELPEMDAQRVDSLLDWRDPNHDARPDGAEEEHYALLRPIPYRAKNNPIFTLDELLFVRGFDATVLYGEDANRNGLLDEAEDDGETSFPPDDANGELRMGLSACVTPFSYEYDVDSSGQPRTNLNTARSISGQSLPAGLDDFRRAMQDEGVTFTHPAQLLEMTWVLQADHTDINPQWTPGTIVRSGVGAAELPAVLDRLTCEQSGGPRGALLVGRVNVQTAPAKVLAALPGMDDNLARRIVAERDSLSAEQRQNIAWLFMQGLVDAETFRAIAPMLTARGLQYRVRSVGYCPARGVYRVLEAVIDAARERPRLLYLRDITPLGLPIDPAGQQAGER